MANEKGTSFVGADGQVAVRTGSNVAVGDYFVFHPNTGGYYENDPDRIADIESWQPLLPDPDWKPPAPPEPEPAPPTPQEKVTK